MSEVMLHTAEGVLAGIVEKPTGWTTIEVAMAGKQYPLKLDTKKQELIELARAAGQNTMQWSYTEHDSGTPNPHKPGSNYINRRFEGVAPVQNGGSAETDSPDPEKMSKEEWLLKDRAADKRALIAIASSALQHTIPSDPTDDDLKNFNERVLTLSGWWHNVVISTRENDDIPF